MKRFVVIVSLLVVGYWPALGQTYPSGWDTRWSFTIAAADLCASGSTDTEAQDFFLDKTENDWRNAANGGDVDDATKLRIQTAADAVLDWELISHNTTTGQIQAWIDLGSIACNSDVTIYIYGGNSGAADQTDPANVWDNFALVAHLDDSFTEGTADDLKDSSGGNNHGTANGTSGWTDNSLVTAPGGQGIQCDNSNAEYVAFGAADFTKNATQFEAMILTRIAGNTSGGTLDYPLSGDWGNEPWNFTHHGDFGLSRNRAYLNAGAFVLQTSTNSGFDADDQTVWRLSLLEIDGTTSATLWGAEDDTGTTPGTAQFFLRETDTPPALTYGTGGIQRIAVCGDAGATNWTGDIAEAWVTSDGTLNDIDYWQTVARSIFTAPGTVGAKETSGGGGASTLNSVVVF